MKLRRTPTNCACCRLYPGLAVTLPRRYNYPYGMHVASPDKLLHPAHAYNGEQRCYNKLNKGIRVC
jgi:hypothetical protein